MRLIIVESPVKSKTLQSFLSKDYLVRSSYGHIRDLPKSKLGVDIENNFEPKYIVPLKARKKVSELKKYLEKAEKCILASDEDREGEAIAWHLVQALGLNEIKSPVFANASVGKRISNLKNNYERIVFHEITKEAIEEALKNPRKIDMDLVDAQQARRVLDRLVGYKLSPFLWKKVASGLSAGRVQSVAVRLICDREKEIKEFKPEEYWTIVAILLKIKNDPAGSHERQQISKMTLRGVADDNKNKEFEAILFKKDEKVIPKLGIKNKEEAENIIRELEGVEYNVSRIERKEKTLNPLPPFTTSLLQQDAWQKFHFSAKFTMMLAQSLYERGMITYHRTDSFNLSEQSLVRARKVIGDKFGKEYFAGFFRRFKTKSKLAQEAHEAIRPTVPEKTAEELDDDLKSEQRKLYDLIWKRFIASQMASSRLDSTIVEIEAQSQKSNLKSQKFIFKADGQIIKFDGFLKVYPLAIKENILPELEEKEILNLIKLTSAQHFTKPPSRYSEATLIKALERYGIGRPSTYAPTLATIQDRNYIEKDEKKKLKPTEIGMLVNNLLCSHFPNIVDINFTAKMEEDLDKIAGGEFSWQEPLKNFYFPFEENLKKKEKEIPQKKIIEEKTDEICPKCGKPLVIKLGRYGKFYACSGWPACKFTRQYLNTIGIKCPKCKEGDVIERKAKSRKIFYGCSRFPKCDFISWKKPVSP